MSVTQINVRPHTRMEPSNHGSLYVDVDTIRFTDADDAERMAEACMVVAHKMRTRAHLPEPDRDPVESVG